MCPSIAVDPNGRLVSRVDNYASPGSPLTAAVPVDPVPTVYAALGDYFDWLCLILALTCMTLAVIFRFRK